MQYVLFIWFAIVYLIILIIILGLKNAANKKINEPGLKKLAAYITSMSTGLKCTCFNSGRKGAGLRFNRCDVYILEDAVFICGFTKILSYKIFTGHIFLTLEPAKYYPLQLPFNIVKPKKINPYSFNNEVYIEFGESGWNGVNTEIRIKGLAEEQKKLLIIHNSYN